MATGGFETAATRAASAVSRQLTGRRLALLGGTTTLADCLVAMRLLCNPGKLNDGSTIAEFEQAFARQIGVRYASSFCSGRVGLYGLLGLFGVGMGDEVLVQAPTHIVVANAIRYRGARPIYVDCRRDNYNIDLDHAERLISPRTRVLILQHTFGNPVDFDAALDLARRHNLRVVEDCVHALGATYDGRQVGSFGHAAFFSTEETKIISTTMGGMVVTDDPSIASELRIFQLNCSVPPRSLSVRYVIKLIAYHLLTEPHLHRVSRSAYDLFGRHQPLPRPTSLPELKGDRPPDYERRLSNAQAALGLRQLKRLDANLAHRRRLAGHYHTLLSERGIPTLWVSERSQPSYVRYPLWVADRDDAVRSTAPYTVLGTWFTSVLEEAASPAHGDYVMGSCPNAEEAAKHLVNLPTHPRVTLWDAEAIVSALAEPERSRGARA